jgi:hypothetical protein
VRLRVSGWAKGRRRSSHLHALGLERGEGLVGHQVLEVGRAARPPLHDEASVASPAWRGRHT